MAGIDSPGRARLSGALAASQTRGSDVEDELAKILERGLDNFSRLHSSLVVKRIKAGFSVTDFSYRTGLSEVVLNQFEAEPLCSEIRILLIYAMAVGEICHFSN